VEHDIIQRSVVCNKCGGDSKITVCKRWKNGLAYVCGKRSCKTICNIVVGSFETNKIGIRWFLRIVYCFIFEFNNNQLILNGEVSEMTIIKIKKQIIQAITKKQWTRKIGGINNELQLDETAICNGKIITCPSNALD
jgi:hypothetical protein